MTPRVKVRKEGDLVERRPAAVQQGCGSQTADAKAEDEDVFIFHGDHVRTE